MTKLRIWVVDDVDNQREMVISALIPSAVDLSNNLRAKFAKQLFDIVEFSSAKNAELALIEGSEEDFPDLILSDNDFSTAFEVDIEDNRADRGLLFLEMVHQLYPRIHKILITSFMVNPYLERFIDLQQGKSTITLFAIDRDKISNEGRLNQCVRNIAQQKLYLIDEEGKNHLATLYDNVSSLFESKAEEVPSVVIENRSYLLDSLLAPWTKLQYNGEGELILVFEDEDFSEIANTLFSPFTPTRAQVFKGQLDTTIKQNDPPETLVFKQQLQQLLSSDQSERIEQLIPEVSNALSIFFTFCPNWLSIQEEKHLSVNSQNTILQQQNHNPKDLAELRSQCTNANLKLSSEYNDIQVEKNWLNILRCRLVIQGIFALKQRGTIFQELPFAIDFAIQVILRNNPKNFLRRLYSECPNMARLPQITDDLGASGSNGASTTVQFFNTFSGLGGGITHRIQVDTDQHYFKQESIQQECLFPGERKWMLDIKKGNLLKGF